MGKANKNAGAQTPPKPPETMNEELRQRAHARVDQLFDDSSRGRFYGRIGVEVAFENGVAKEVRRKLEGTDR